MYKLYSLVHPTLRVCGDVMRTASDLKVDAGSGRRCVETLDKLLLSRRLCHQAVKLLVPAKAGK